MNIPNIFSLHNLHSESNFKPPKVVGFNLVAAVVLVV